MSTNTNKKTMLENLKILLFVVLWLVVSYLFYAAMMGTYKKANTEEINKLQKQVQETSCNQDDDILKEILSNEDVYVDELNNVLIISGFCEDVEIARKIKVISKCAEAINYAKDVIEEAKSNPTYVGSYDSRRSRLMRESLQKCEDKKNESDLF